MLLTLSRCVMSVNGMIISLLEAVLENRDRQKHRKLEKNEQYLAVSSINNNWCTCRKNKAIWLPSSQVQTAMFECWSYRFLSVYQCASSPTVPPCEYKANYFSYHISYFTLYQIKVIVLGEKCKSYYNTMPTILFCYHMF